MVASMRDCFFINPVFLLPAHAMSPGYLSGRPRFVESARFRTIAERLKSILSFTRVPLVHDNHYRHLAAPNAAEASGVIGLSRQPPMASRPVDFQGRRDAMPGRPFARIVSSSSGDSETADFVVINRFHPRIWRGQRLSFSDNSKTKLVFTLRCLADTYPESPPCAIYPPIYQERIAQVSVAALVERSIQSNSRLNGYDPPFPCNLINHSSAP